MEVLAEEVRHLRHLLALEHDISKLAAVAENLNVSPGAARVFLTILYSRSVCTIEKLQRLGLMLNLHDELLSVKTIHVYVHRLRLALWDTNLRIHTMRGIGYRIEGELPEWLKSMEG